MCRIFDQGKGTKVLMGKGTQNIWDERAGLGLMAGVFPKLASPDDFGYHVKLHFE